MNTITIDRSRWLHGEGGRASSLQRATDGKRCCIGFVCLAFGAKEEDIIGKANPVRLDKPIHRLGPWVVDALDSKDGNTALYAAFAINDARIGRVPGTEPVLFGPSQEIAEYAAKYGDGPIASDADREARLVKLFASQGIELVFEGEYPTPPAPEGEVTP
jgi:hypothetical protein